MRTSRRLHSFIGGLALAACGLAPAQTQGVTKDEILVGTLQDLSGPLAGYGKDLRNGMQMRIAEANDKGGVHGRKLRLLVEDSGYDPKRAVLATQKLVNQDRIFVMAGSLGTGVNNAALPVLASKNTLNFFPAALSRDMYEPVSKLKFAFLSSYYDQIAPAAARLYREKKAARPCIIYQDDEYGLEILRGTEAGLKTVGAELVEKTSFKRGATDFSSQVARMKAAGCDFVVTGTLIRETVGTLNEARRIDFNPTFLGAFGTYTDLIHKLGGKPMDGFYSTMTVQHPYEDTVSDALKPWLTAYRGRFNEAPSAYSIYGYVIADRLVQALDKAGAQPDTDSLARAVEAMKTPADMFGVPELSFAPDRHLGSNKARLSQIQDGRWKVVLDYDQMAR
ncbi:ABC transporter substrate-binding protein [Pseudacidovorax intermedius]|uniref:ABC transporter substrate-binding protein n=1 Tax=Pseudacidovorax intermedius TaxID=433924 RepID=UPI0026ECF70E|nr:ABC transporter substrate-binding protein [Pseudacidovorax intermedius]